MLLYCFNTLHWTMDMCIYFLLTSMELTLAGDGGWCAGPGGLSDRAHVFSACIYVMPTLDSDTAITATTRILRGLPDKSKYEDHRRASNVPLLWNIRAPGVCLVIPSESLGHTRHDHSALALAGDQVLACTALEGIHHNLHLWPNLKYFVSSPQM